jgi:predicted enzyme related to lactoylglutathione lyase
MPAAVVHFEIAGPDGRQLAEFYSALFGWATHRPDGAGRALVDTRGGTGINGSIITSPVPSVTFYVETDDLQAALDKVNLLGGRTEAPVAALPGLATVARFSDLDGLHVGLVLAPADRDRDIAPGAGGGAPVDWFEILGADADRSRRFYAQIFGWRADVVGPGYLMVSTGTPRGIRGGIGAAEGDGWATVYASVADVEATLAKAAELGGARGHGPLPVDDHMQTGTLRDPAGNIFGAYHHEPH